MAVIQSSYSPGMVGGIPGMVASMWSDNDAGTRICEELSIGFGLAVCEGVNPRGCRFMGDNNSFIGISMIDVSLLAKQGQVQDRYLQTFNAGIFLQGDIWVRVVSAVSHGQAATFHPTDGTIDNQAAAFPTIDNARFRSSAPAGGVALLRVCGKTP